MQLQATFYCDSKYRDEVFQSLNVCFHAKHWFFKEMAPGVIQVWSRTAEPVWPGAAILEFCASRSVDHPAAAIKAKQATV